MSAPVVVSVESKSAKKRKAKTEAAVPNSTPSPVGEITNTATDSHPATNGIDQLAESSIVRDLTK
jgi:hypothetical protein